MKATESGVVETTLPWESRVASASVIWPVGAWKPPAPPLLGTFGCLTIAVNRSGEPEAGLYGGGGLVVTSRVTAALKWTLTRGSANSSGSGVTFGSLLINSVALGCSLVLVFSLLI